MAQIWGKIAALRWPAMALAVLATACGPVEEDGTHASVMFAPPTAAPRSTAEPQGRVSLPGNGKTPPYLPTIPPPVWAQEQKLFAADGANLDEFGASVAISGDTAIVGAWYDDDNGYQSGSAYVFVRQGGAWTQQQKLLASDGDTFHLFGTAVSISGNTALIGAPNANGGFGAAYVFERVNGVWTEKKRLTPLEGQLQCDFGIAVSIAGDIAAVGAPDDYYGYGGGAAFVYVRAGGVWTEEEKLTFWDGAPWSYFGRSVSVSGDTVVVGGTKMPGKYVNEPSVDFATVFVRAGGAWPEQQTLAAPDSSPGDGFGSSLSISGDTVVVGMYQDDDKGIRSGSACVFVRNGGIWTEQQKLLASDGAAEHGFGDSVAASGDTIVVGAHRYYSQAGAPDAAYVFTRASGVWTEKQKLVPLNGGASDSFNGAVALSGDTAVMGGGAGADGNVPDSGAAYVFVAP